MKTKGLSVVLAGVMAATGMVLAEANSLGVASTERTADWNPVNPTTYPALLVSRLVSERLYERKCRSRRGDIEELDYQCQSENEEPMEGGRVRLDLTSKQCGKDRGLPALSVDDVRFTLDQINRAPYNEYRHYDISLEQTGLLKLGEGDQGIGLAQLHKFDFPLIRQGPDGDLDFWRTRMDVGRLADLNAHTGGFYEVEGIAPKSIRLRARSGAGAGMSTIQFTELALELDKLDVLQRDDQAPDVMLAVPIAFPHPANRYDPRHSEDLASFTYIGFNFGHPSFRRSQPRQQDLIENPEFREWITRSLWTVDIVRDKFGIGRFDRGSPGIFLGQSFDPLTGSPPDSELANEVAAKVKDFLRKQKLNRPLEMTLLISPEIYKHFTSAEVDGLVEDLEAIWSPDGVNGLRIYAKKKDTPALYSEAKAKGDYHLVFDDFVYGRNVRRQAAFVDPAATGAENFLSINVFRSDEIQGWLRDPINGMKRFREQVATRYPVAVLGAFPRRDLFSTRIQRPAVDCGTAQVMPYFGISQWSLGRP